MKWRAPEGALGKLVAGAQEDCAERRAKHPTLESRVCSSLSPKAGRFVSALAQKKEGEFPLICEVKRASPSAGALVKSANAPDVAKAYADSGARCISVLTEGRRFGGSLDDLRKVREAVDLPLLRKDFTVHPHMVFEAADAGADCILLIVAAVEPFLLLEMADAAKSVGLDVLLELIYPRDLDILAARNWDLVGINARDLETLVVDKERFPRLAKEVRSSVKLLVAESGIKEAEDIRRVRSEGADAALVGETLMRAEDRSKAVRRLVSA